MDSQNLPVVGKKDKSMSSGAAPRTKKMTKKRQTAAGAASVGAAEEAAEPAISPRRTSTNEQSESGAPEVAPEVVPESAPPGGPDAESNSNPPWYDGSEARPPRASATEGAGAEPARRPSQEPPASLTPAAAVPRAGIPSCHSEVQPITPAPVGPSARRLLTKYNLEPQCVGVVQEAMLKDLQKATFNDAKWDQAMQHIKASTGWSEGALTDLLRRGARSFGFWHLEDEVLRNLVHHLSQQETSQSPALTSWMAKVDAARQQGDTGLNKRGRVDRTASSNSRGVVTHLTGKESASREGLWQKVALFLGVVAAANISAGDIVVRKYPGVVALFGPPLYAARVGGMATLLWTGILFLTMSRTCLTFLGRAVRSKILHSFIDVHKELHVFSGQMLLAFAVLHTLSHLISTMPCLLREPLDKINDVLGCANPERNSFSVSMPALQLPACPLQSRPTMMGVLFRSTPGLTGVALCVLLGLVVFTAARKRRSQRFEVFYYVHLCMIPLWLTLLFIHGSNNWIGVGFPQVLIVCSLPFACYFLDRVLRVLRYRLFAGKRVKIADVVIRPGPGDSAKDALIHLQITKPPYLWVFGTGMYAFLNMPEYAPFQWHPFTVCSSPDCETVDFIIKGVGDWTVELAQRVLDVRNGSGSLPKVALDGPYRAPTVTAMSHKVIVAVGAGVGITPFLSLMATVVSTLGDDEGDGSKSVNEVHVYWMTRNADEFLFGRGLFTQIFDNPNLRDRVFLHLHVTFNAPDKDVSAYLFREAVRRQNRIDKQAFKKAVDGLSMSQMAVGTELPWCWANGGQEDIIWVDSLLEAGDSGVEKAADAVAQDNHWSAGVAIDAGVASIPPAHWAPESRASVASRGLFRRRRSTAVRGGVPPCAVKEAGPPPHLPVVFARPDWKKEIQAIGRAWPGYNVHVYVCGNDMLVQTLQSTCSAISQQEKAAPVPGVRPRSYLVHFERFD